MTIETGHFRSGLDLQSQDCGWRSTLVYYDWTLIKILSIVPCESHFVWSWTIENSSQIDGIVEIEEKIYEFLKRGSMSVDEIYGIFY